MRPVFGLLSEGRGPFLEFLRNLTPQVLLIGIAAKIGSSLDFATWDAANWAETSLFVACLLLFFASVAANAMHFTHGYVEAMNQAAFQHADKSTSHSRSAHHKGRLFRSLMKQYGLAYVQSVLVASTVIQFAYAAVVWQVIRGYVRSSS